MIQRVKYSDYSRSHSKDDISDDCMPSCLNKQFSFPFSSILVWMALRSRHIEGLINLLLSRFVILETPTPGHSKLWLLRCRLSFDPKEQATTTEEAQSEPEHGGDNDRYYDGNDYRHALLVFHGLRVVFDTESGSGRKLW
jgi:hypothetical protein